MVYPITSVGIKALSLLTAGVNRPTHYVERGEREAWIHDPIVIQDFIRLHCSAWVVGNTYAGRELF